MHGLFDDRNGVWNIKEKSDKMKSVSGIILRTFHDTYINVIILKTL